MPEPTRCALWADFNAANLASYLEADAGPPSLDCRHQMAAGPEPAALDAALSRSEAAVLWFRAERVSPSIAAALDGGAVPSDAAVADADRFAASVARCAARAGIVLVPSWTMPPQHRAFGMAAFKADGGVAAAIQRMNVRLIDRLADVGNVYVLDAARWLAAGGSRAFDPRLWYMAKIPYANAVFRSAAADLKAAIRGAHGEARKLVILDLDNTLWGGLVGETGWEGLRLGGHDPIGEAFVDFQRALKALASRGVLLAIASKNDERIALDAIHRHPEMVLRETDFAALRINWHDKAQNVADVLDDLRLTASSAVFIDDHPAERARVREALPDMLVPDWPASPLFYPSTLLGLNCFDSPALTAEDRGRQELYRAEAARSAARGEVPSLDDWLQTLGLRIQISGLNPSNCIRAAQLLNKTNQMNLSTRRLSTEEFRDWAAQSDCRVWTFRLADRFGDAGLTGVLSLQLEADTARIVDFIVSCRVLGRRLEEAMLHHAVEEARRAGARRLVADYRPTPRNGPCKQFFDRSGLTCDNGDRYVWDAGTPYPVPPFVALELGDVA